jgi:hypothetical protein
MKIRNQNLLSNIFIKHFKYKKKWALKNIFLKILSISEIYSFIIISWFQKYYLRKVWYFRYLLIKTSFQISSFPLNKIYLMFSFYSFRLKELILNYELNFHEWHLIKFNCIISFKCCLTLSHRVKNINSSHLNKKQWSC